MADQEIPSTSTEYFRAAVAANRDEVINGTVEFSFSTTDDDDDLVWTAGTWFSNIKSIEQVDGVYKDAYVAQVLIGPNGDVTLSEAEYFSWLRITLGQQEIVRQAGKLKVT